MHPIATALIIFAIFFSLAAPVLAAALGLFGVALAFTYALVTIHRRKEARREAEAQRDRELILAMKSLGR